MKVIFLGTNGWYDTETGNTPCVLVQTGTEHIIFDAGFGLHKLGNYIKDEKPIYLFISHLHLDHIIGLHVLPIFHYAQGIDIYTLPGSRKLLESIMTKPFTRPIESMAPFVRVHEYSSAGRWSFGFEFRELLHAVPCYGFKITSGGRSVSFCTDTEDCRALRALAKDTDLLITECAFKSGEETKGSSHLNPEAAAGAAVESGAAMLALYHFDPARYPTLKYRIMAEKAAQAIFKNTVAANDGKEIIVS